MRMNQPNIVYFTKHTTAGPSSRHRSYAYHDFLRQNGFSITVYPLFPASYLPIFYKTGRKPILLVLYAYLRRLVQLLLVKHTAICFIEYELFPYVPFFLEKWLLRNQQRIVLDYDDAIFHNYDQSPHRLIQNLCGTKIFRLVSLANVVITGSSYLTNKLSPYAKQVVEIPTSIHLQHYQSAPPYLPADDQTFRIGWIGSATTSIFVLGLKMVLMQLQQCHNVQLVLIGFNPLLQSKLAGLQTVLYDWQEDTEAALLKTCDVGIMPLTDEPFNHGKCGFKLIQYMACGLPTISTPMETNRNINHDGHNLFASTEDEWARCFETVIHNRAFYRLAGEKNISIAAQHYSVENNRQVYLSIFQQLMRSFT